MLSQPVDDDKPVPVLVYHFIVPRPGYDSNTVRSIIVLPFIFWAVLLPVPVVQYCTFCNDDAVEVVDTTAATTTAAITGTTATADINIIIAISSAPFAVAALVVVVITSSEHQQY